MSIVNTYKGKLLIAKPVLFDDFFNRTVILILDDNEYGSLGFILNKPLNQKISEYINYFDIENMVYEGGPVNQDNIYFIHSRPDLIKNSEPIFGKFYWSGNFNDVRYAINNKLINSDEIRFFLGYSGWDKGQLNHEIQNESWLVMEDKFNILSDWDNNLWQRQLSKLGGDHLLWVNAPKNPLLN